MDEKHSTSESSKKPPASKPQYRSRGLPKLDLDALSEEQKAALEKLRSDCAKQKLLEKEIVARAKGSPMMRPTLKEARGAEP